MPQLAVLGAAEQPRPKMDARGTAPSLQSFNVMVDAPHGDRVVLVTGGAGFIGSHTAKALFWHGYRPVVFDNLSAGHRHAVQWGDLVHGDVRDRGAVSRAMAEHRPMAVIHFAALTDADLSQRRPDLFYETNVVGLAAVLSAMTENGVPRIVFSSSAEIYDESQIGCDQEPLREDAAKGPITPYGRTMLIGEGMVEAHCRAFGMSGVALRYFNAAGADPDGELAEIHDPETHLIPQAIDAALGYGRPLTVFGRDFDTEDGSSLRDYIHVGDVALAHLAAVEADMPDGAFEPMNVGVGKGHSVLEIIAEVDRTLRTSSLYLVANRRPGEPDCLVVDPFTDPGPLGWSARDSSLARIVETAAAGRRSARLADATPLRAPILSRRSRRAGGGRRRGGVEPL